jgi:competence protein ComGF
MDESSRKTRKYMWKCKVDNGLGFTFIEMLVVMLILMTITSLFPLLFTVLSEWIEEPSKLHPFEWEVAVSQLTMELREAEEITIENGSLRLRNFNQDVILYERFGNLVRRRVNGQGHEVILQNVGAIELYYIADGIRMVVTGIDGKVYEKKIHRWSGMG